MSARRSGTLRFGAPFAIIGFGLLIALATAPARAQLVLGPRFDLDVPLDGRPAWGNQSGPRAATGPSGTLVVWADARGDDLAVAGKLVVRAPETSVAVPRFPSSPPFDSTHDVASAGQGFVIVYQDDSGVVGRRVSMYGKLLDSVPKLLIPAAGPKLAESVDLLDVDCNKQGQCLVAARTRSWDLSPSWNLRLVAFDWNLVPTTDNTLPFAESRFAVVAGADGFVVAYALSGQIHVQMTGATGSLQAPLAALANTTSSPHLPRVARTGNGFALAWMQKLENNQAVLQLARLDATGKITAQTSMDLDDFWVGELVSSGQDAVLLLNSPTGLQLFGIGPAATPMALGGLVEDVRASTAAYDGQQLFVASTFGGPASVTGEDVQGTWLTLPPQSTAQQLILSTAESGQWKARTAESGTSSLVAWNDNREDEGDVLGIALGPDGCPAAKPTTILGGVGTQGLMELASAAGGFFALGWYPNDTPGPYQAPWLWSLGRLDHAGVLAGEVDLGGLASKSALASWPNVGGGASLGWGHYTPDGGVHFIEPDGTSSGSPWAKSNTHRVGRLANGEAFAVVLIVTPAGTHGFEIHFFSENSGEPTRETIQELVELSELDVFVDGDSYLIVSRSYQADFAGRLTAQGLWSGRLPLPATGYTAPRRVGDELWWLRAASKDAPSALARTTLSFEPLGSSSLPEDIEPLALLLGDGTPTLLGSVRSARGSPRLVGHRLDGSACLEPEKPEGSPPTTSVAVPRDAAEPAGGCACRTGNAARGWRGPLAWLLLAALIGAQCVRKLGQCPSRRTDS